MHALIVYVERTRGFRDFLMRLDRGSTSGHDATTTSTHYAVNESNNELRHERYHLPIFASSPHSFHHSFHSFDSIIHKKLFAAHFFPRVSFRFPSEFSSSLIFFLFFATVEKACAIEKSYNKKSWRDKEKERDIIYPFFWSTEEEEEDRVPLIRLFFPRANAAQ